MKEILNHTGEYNAGDITMTKSEQYLTTQRDVQIDFMYNMISALKKSKNK